MAALPWEEPAPRRVALDATTIQDLVAVAGDLADAARGAVLPHFRSRGLHHDDKAIVRPDGNWDPVTAADTACEQAIRDRLAALRPDDGIVGEEAGHSPGTSGLTWVVDPIDGTRAFLAGLPTWGVLIALFDGIEPVIGVVDQPHVDERWVGVATPDERRCEFHHAGAAEHVHARSSADLGTAVLCTAYPEVGASDERVAFERVRDRVMLTRYGADCYAYALIASGTVDLVIEAQLQPWDVAALVPVVRGAGGVITAWDGGPAHAGGRVIAAGDADLHAAARALLGG